MVILNRDSNNFQYKYIKSIALFIFIYFMNYIMKMEMEFE